MDKLFELDPSGSMCAFSDMMQRQIVMPAHLMDDRSHAKSNSREGKANSLFKDFSSVAQATGTYTGKSFEFLFYLSRKRERERERSWGEARRREISSGARRVEHPERKKKRKNQNEKESQPFLIS